MNNNQINRRSAAPKTAFFRQVIVSAVALVIMGAGAWSLWAKQRHITPIFQAMKSAAMVQR